MDKDDHESIEIFQEEEDELQPQRPNEEKLLQSENEKYFAEIAKRDELLNGKDQEIERLRLELEKYRELKNVQEQTEAKLVKLEDLQEFNVKIMKEKDVKIEELREFTRVIDTALNKISEVNNNQDDDDFQVKEKSGLEALVKLEELREFNVRIMKEKDIKIEELREFTKEIDRTLNKISEIYQDDDDLLVKEEENGLEYMKEISVLEEKITEKSRSFSLREISESRSMNGKRNLGSLLGNFEKDSEGKSASTPRRNVNNGKENIERAYSEKSEKDVGKSKKKIKQ